MAKAYRAVTQIKHGMGAEVKVFEPGDKVEDLSGEAMKALWDAGALEEYNAPEAPSKSKGKEETAVSATSKSAAAGTGAASKTEDAGKSSAPTPKESTS